MEQSHRSECIREAAERQTEKTSEAFAIRKSSAAMCSNVIVTYGVVPSITAPFACLGGSTRNTALPVYPTQAAKPFLSSDQDLLMPMIKDELYQILEEPQSRKKKMSSTRSSEEFSTHRGNVNYGDRNYAREQFNGRRNRGSTPYQNKRAFDLY